MTETKAQETEIDRITDKAWSCFTTGLNETNESEKKSNFLRAVSFLTKAESLSPTKDVDLYYIYGQLALNFSYLNNWQKSKHYMQKALAHDPSNMWAKITATEFALEECVKHKGFVMQGDGSFVGLMGTLLTAGISKSADTARRNTWLNSVVEAARAFEYNIQNKENISAGFVIYTSLLLQNHANLLWENNLKDRRVCDALLKTPWDIVRNETDQKINTDEERDKVNDYIDNFEADIHGLLALI